MAHPVSRRLLFALATIPLLGGATFAQSDRVLRIVAPSEFPSLEPVQTGYVLTRLGVGETLVGMEPDGRLVSELAERWDVSPDAKTWCFHIRQGAKFHDGSPVTPEAVLNAFERAWPKAELLSQLPIESVRVERGALVIHLREPFAPLPSFLVDYGGVVLAPASYGPDGKVQKVIGTGRYRIARIEGSTTIEVDAFPDYWGEKPTITRARYTATSLSETRTNVAEAGGAELTTTLLPQAIDRINASGRATVRTATAPRTRMMIMNISDARFDDPRERQALSLAIDRDGIAKAVLRHPGSAGTQLMAPILEGWHNPALPPLRRDVAQAKRLLAEAGWKAGPDGILEKDGKRFAISMIAPSNRPELPVIAQALQSQFKEVGIALDAKAGPFSQIASAAKNGTLESALLARNYGQVADPIGILLPDFLSDVSAWSSIHYNNEELRRLLRDYAAALEDERAGEIRKRITDILHRDLPVIPIAWFEYTVAVSTALDPRSVEVDPFERSYRLNKLKWAN